MRPAARSAVEAFREPPSIPRAEESRNPLFEHGQVARPALPNHEQIPSEPSQGAPASPVTRHVSAPFLFPETRIGLRLHASVAASVHVPEAAVYEEHLTQLRKDEIRLAGEVLSMQSESVAHAVHQASHDQLRLRVPGPDSGHAKAPLCGCENVGHDSAKQTVN